MGFTDAGVGGMYVNVRSPTVGTWVRTCCACDESMVWPLMARSIVQLALSAEVEGKTGLYFNQLKPKEPSKLALDDELAERLWAESARLVKL